MREVTLNDSDFLYDLYLKRSNEDTLSKIEYDDQKIFVKNYVEKLCSHPFQSWFIIEIDGKKAGSLSLNKNRNEVGYWLLPEFQNQGIGTDAIQQFLLINKKSYYTIRTHFNNKRSQHIAEKLNFSISHFEYRLEF